MSLEMLEGKELLKGKKIIVTGGAGGIGSATVYEYVRQGAIVTSIDIRDDDGEKFAAEAAKAGSGKVTYVHCDCTDREAVAAAFAKAKEDMGGFDVLIHTAAIEDFKKAGFEPAMIMESSGGLKVAYIDCLKPWGHYVEIHNPQPYLHEMCAAARESWDGSDPVRPMRRG